MKISKYENVFLCTNHGKHSFAGQKGKHSFAAPTKPWVKRQTHTQLHPYVGRGVWESNPPGTAPSDPPAVLKTVRPTGAPTPPCLSLYCAIDAIRVSSQRTHPRHVNLLQGLHHQLGLA